MKQRALEAVADLRRAICRHRPGFVTQCDRCLAAWALEFAANEIHELWGHADDPTHTFGAYIGRDAATVSLAKDYLLGRSFELRRAAEELRK
jgi:hypothetical protein